MQFGPKGYQARGRAMSSMEQQDKRRILGQMVRFQDQAAVRIDNDCVKRREIDWGGTNPRRQGQEKEKKNLFHVRLFHTAVTPHTPAPTQRTVILLRKLSTSSGVKQTNGLIKVAETKTPDKALPNQSLKPTPHYKMSPECLP